jgi:hypothetical protein
MRQRYGKYSQFRWKERAVLLTLYWIDHKVKIVRIAWTIFL